MVYFIENYYLSLGIPSWFARSGSWMTLVVSVSLICLFANFIAKTYILRLVRFAIQRTKTKWDDLLMDHHVFDRLSHFVPAIILYFTAPLFPVAESIIVKVAFIYMLFIGTRVVSSFLNALVDIYNTMDDAIEKPIKGYVQVVKIFIYIGVGIVFVATLLDKSPWGLLSGIGAMTAIIMLVFKDSILGFVASIQISAYDLVRKGDWIEIPSLKVDGDVVDVSINTVKIQNFDKTFTSVPTYKLISEPVKNWRGMQEAGGRRIKRSIRLNMNTVKFCDEAMLARFKDISLLKNYIEETEQRLKQFNADNKVDNSVVINGKRQTNLGCFRAYIQAYLKNNPKIHSDGKMTFLVRQLAPEDNGVAIELYVFVNDTNWVNYEGIQADIFDHLLASVKTFDLKVFQDPSGSDFSKVVAA